MSIFTIASGTTLTLDSADIISGLKGGGTLHITATGVTLIGDEASFTGTIHVATGTSLDVGNGGTTGSPGTGVITLDAGATLSVTRSDDVALTNAIGGGGQISKSGLGFLTLSGNNTYSGGTSLYAGTLDVAGATSAGTGPITFNSGAQTLDIEKTALIGSLFSPLLKSFGAEDAVDVRGIGTATSALILQNNYVVLKDANGGLAVLHFDPSQDLSNSHFDLASDGAGGTLLKLASGAASANPNVYYIPAGEHLDVTTNQTIEGLYGSGTLNVQDAFVALVGDESSYTGDIHVSGHGVVDVGYTNDPKDYVYGALDREIDRYEASYLLGGRGYPASPDPSQGFTDFSRFASGPTGSLGSGAVYLDSAGSILRFNRSTDIIVTNDIAGSGRIEKFGAYNLYHSDFLGDVPNSQVEDLWLGNVTLVGDIAVQVTDAEAGLIIIKNTTTREYSGDVVVAPFQGFAAFETDAPLTLTGSLLAPFSWIYKTGASSLTLEGLVSPPVDVPGYSYPGKIYIREGTLNIGDADWELSSGSLVLSPGASLQFTGSSDITIPNDLEADATDNAAGPASLVLDSNITLTLSGNSSSFGNIFLNAGTLKAVGGKSLPSQGEIFFGNGIQQLDLAPSLLSNHGVLQTGLVNFGPGDKIYLRGIGTATAVSLTDPHAGDYAASNHLAMPLLFVSGPGMATVALPFLVGRDPSDIIVGSDGAGGTVLTMTGPASGSLDYLAAGETGTLDDTETLVDLSGAGTLEILSGAVVTLARGVNPTGFSGSIQVDGGGTLRLGTGIDTTVKTIVSNGGEIDLADAVAIGAPLNIGAGITKVNVAASDTASLYGTITGTSQGALEKTGSGTLILSGDNSYSGGTYLYDGILDVASSTALGTGKVVFNSGAQELDITATALSSGGGKFTPIISGYGTEDSIDLRGIGSASSIALDGSSLLVKDTSLGTITLQLDPSQDWSGYQFSPVADGHGGTIIKMFANVALDGGGDNGGPVDGGSGSVGSVDGSASGYVTLSIDADGHPIMVIAPTLNPTPNILSSDFPSRPYSSSDPITLPVGVVSAELSGPGGDGWIYGNEYKNGFTVLSGSWRINGLAEEDTLYFKRPLSDFDIQITSTGFKFDANGVSVTSVNLEQMYFSDAHLHVDTSPEAATVFSLYRTALERNPDVVGETYWLNRMKHGASLPELANSFAGSEEFANKYGPYTTDEAYVSALYSNVLLRKPDQEGLAFWMNDLKAEGRAALLLQFSASSEEAVQMQPLISRGILVAEDMFS